MKKFTKICLVITSVIVAALSLAGCDFLKKLVGGSENDVDGDVIDTKDMLAAPTLTLLDDLIMWEPIANANTYTVVLNSVEQTSQTECKISIDTAIDNVVKVYADNNGKFKRSKASAICMRAADPNNLVKISDKDSFISYSEQTGNDAIERKLSPNPAYSFDCDTSNSYSFGVVVVPQEVKLLRINGVNETVRMSILAEERMDTLIIECNDVDIEASRSEAIKVKGGKLIGDIPNVVVRGLGKNNSIRGGNNTTPGANGATASGMEMGHKGAKGNKGFSAIDAPIVLFNGVSGMELYGGQGSRGGNGGDSGKTWVGIYWNEGGAGGDGGDGGDCLTCEKMFLNIISGEKLTTCPGFGDLGGNKGRGLADFGNDAKTGARGKDTLGAKVVISGALVPYAT